MRNFLLDFYLPAVCGIAVFSSIVLFVINEIFERIVVYPSYYNSKDNENVIKIYNVMFGAALFIIYILPLIVLTTIFIVYLCGSVGSFALSQTSNPWSIGPFVALSLLLYKIKKRQPLLYGTLEILIGISAIWFSITTSQVAANPVQKLITISGGVYIIVRGIDNASKQVEPIARAYTLLLELWRALRFRKRMEE